MLLGDAVGMTRVRRSPATSFDILMLLNQPGGRIRTEAEFRALFTAGLRLTRVIPTASPNSILECVRA